MRSQTSFLAAALLFAFAASAADPSGFKLWSAHELKASNKSGMLADFGNHNARMTHRDKDGEVEVHQNWTDVIVIESGESTLLIGGTPVDPKMTDPGEFRAKTVTGAEKRPVAPGDILHIPAGVPHQFLVAPGKTVDYFALKVTAK